MPTPGRTITILKDGKSNPPELDMINWPPCIKYLLSLTSLYFLTMSSWSQVDTSVDFKKPFRIIDVGFEFQAYPTGLLPGLRVEANLGKRDALNLRVAAQLINHFSFGKHEVEVGEGGGFSMGYRHYFLKKPMRGIFLGVRADVWFNHIRWTRYTPVQVSGVSDIVVLQPTAEAGWLFRIKNDRWFIAPSIAFGYEWNIIVQGEQTGYGTIILGGVSFGYSFHPKRIQ